MISRLNGPAALKLQRKPSVVFIREETSTSKTLVSVASPSSNAKGTPPLKGSTKARRLSFPITEKEKTVVEGGVK
ncbi:unnamed protein product [Lathyrus sativus]|nr:unnamed protein product [Lathyrus sativus]